MPRASEHPHLDVSPIVENELENTFEMEKIRISNSWVRIGCDLLGVSIVRTPFESIFADYVEKHAGSGQVLGVKLGGGTAERPRLYTRLHSYGGY